jgi:predicted AAA+ superfamily ATPase
MIEAAVRQIHGFSRFLTIVAANSGGWLDFSKLAQKAKVDRSAARRYYELLEDTLICDRVESYSDEGALDLVKHPKFYLFDLGIVNAVLDNFKPSQDRICHLFEHLFFNQLKNTSFALDKKI